MKDVKDSFEYDVLVNTREIVAVGEVNDEFYTKLVKNILLLKDKKDIKIYLHSPGGQISLAAGIYDLIQSLSCEVTIIILGEASSAASYILQAADRRLISKNSTLMMHDWCCSIDESATNIKNLVKIADKIFDKMVEAYLSKSQMSEKQFRSKIKSDWYLTAEEAVKLGFADDLY